MFTKNLRIVYIFKFNKLRYLKYITFKLDIIKRLLKYQNVHNLNRFSLSLINLILD